MPEYLSPGVYVEEVSFRAKFIEGVSTSTTGIVGQTSFGPTSGVPNVVTSYSEFARTYGDFQDLQLSTGPLVNYTAHAARAFFDNGGQRLYVARAVSTGTPPTTATLTIPGAPPLASVAARYPGSYGNRLRLVISMVPANGNLIVSSGGLATLKGVYEGAMVQLSNTAVTGAPTVGGTFYHVHYDGSTANLYNDANPPVKQTFTTAQFGYLVELQFVIFLDSNTSPSAVYAGVAPHKNATNFVGTYFDPIQPTDATGQISVTGIDTSTAFNATNLLRFLLGSGTGSNLSSVAHTGVGTGLVSVSLAPASPIVATVTASGALGTMTFTYSIGGGPASSTVASVGPGPFVYPVPGTQTTLTFPAGAYVLNATYTSDVNGAVINAGGGPTVTQASMALAQDSVVVTVSGAGTLGVGTFTYSTDGGVTTSTATTIPASGVFPIPNSGVVLTFSGTFTIADAYRFFAAGGTEAQQLAGGTDGALTVGVDVQGDNTNELNPTGLYSLAHIDDISIVMGPDAIATTDQRAQDIHNTLISHAEAMRYRIAVLDIPRNKTSSQTLDFRSKYDSSYAAIYTPWIQVSDPRIGNQGKLLALPPSGFVTGIYARTDINRGVWKAPANEVVLGAIDFDQHIHKGVQDILNPRNVNCLRFFEQGGFRVWGARTLSSDPEWKYVNVRRLFLYLEHSIDHGTQWVVFEPNNERTWANVRNTISDFLFTVWKQGALIGAKPEDAYFVKCDRTTMTQNDLDNGRLICLIGVAPATPAEFVIFRIGQWTADAQQS